MIDRLTSQKISNGGLLCALFVVFLHMPIGLKEGTPIYWVWYCIRWGVCDGAVPFFFTVSGWLLSQHIGEENWYRRAIVKRFHSLLMPLVVWTFVGVTIDIGLGDLQLAEFWCSKSIGPLWFLRQLFIMTIFSPLLYRITGIWSLLCIAWVSILQVGGGGGAFRPFGLFYFMIGMYIRKNNIRCEIPRFSAVVSLMIGCALQVYAYGCACESLTLSTIKFVAMIFELYTIFGLTPSCSIPVAITACSFPIYLMHMMVYEVFTHIGHGHSLLHLIATALMAVIIPCLMSITTKRYVPRIADILWGGR